MSTTTAPTPGLTIPALARALPRVEAEIHRMATSSSPPIVNEFSGRITAAGGKRLRSVLALASTVALAGEVTDRAVTAARGPGPAVLVGDFMLARAGQMALRDISPFAAERLAEAVADLVEGQVLEVLDLHDPHRTPENALRSIALKTGALFRVGRALRRRRRGHGRALLAGDPDEVPAAVRRGPMVEDTLGYCRDLARRTATALPDLPASESADVPRALPSAYLNWASALIA